ncbi:hypothetical protein F503_04925 [Ophiostoma piceae UAMH 11346]|uniref:Uncharacterized protein n=1 Tax=Ophiostoma piceae (strain UAMH 11346) TaxID=1262450 RepID=S3BUB1_OPHP1|nr:hypothetical protein F503_04925 [Ophiostoma piceae UAMH 11346]
MAHSNSFNTSTSSPSIASPAASNHSGHSGSSTTASFSIFQEGPGQDLVFAPPRGTPELQALIDLFIALDIPASMKMEMIQRDFEAHAARTNERYKTYFVSGSAAPTASVSPVVPIAATTPTELTASPSPLFNNTFDFSFGIQQTSGSGSGSGSVYLDASPATRSSPTGSDLTAASEALVPFEMYSAQFAPFMADQSLDISHYINNSGFFPMTTTADQSQQMVMMHSTTAAASPAWPATLPTATSPSDLLASSRSPLVQRVSHHRRTQDHRQQRPSAQPQRRQLTGSSSMQIITRTGEDVTHMSSRATRTHEERENTRLVRQRGACPDCRRKKTRCNPGHAGSSLDHVVNRAAPYTSPVLSGRARQEVTAAQAAKAAKEKKAGKQAVTTLDPVFTAPQSIASSILSGVEGGGGIHTDHSIDLGLNLLQDSFDWNQLSNQDFNFTSDDLDLDIAATLSMTTPSTTTTATAAATQTSQLGTGLAHTGEYGVLPPRPRDPPRPTRVQLRPSHMNPTDQSLLLSYAATPAVPNTGTPGNSRRLQPVSIDGDSSTMPASSLPVQTTHRSPPNLGDLVTGDRDFCGLPDTESTMADDGFSWAIHSSPTSSATTALSGCAGIESSDASSIEACVSEPSEHERGPGCEPRGHESPVPDVEESHSASEGGLQICRTEPTSTTQSNTVRAESNSKSDSKSKSRTLTHSSQPQSQPQSPSQLTEPGVAQPAQGTLSLSEDTLVVLTGLAGLAQTLIPAYLAWTAAQFSDDLVAGLGEGMERLSIAPAMVACQ